MSGVKNRVTVKGTVQARKTVRGGIGYRTLQGEPGKDGISPLARVDKSGDTATITITDADGTTTATVKDGHTPQKGVDYLTPGEVHEVAEEVLQDKIITDIQDDISDVKETLSQKYTKPSTGIPASDLASGVIPDVSGKADIVSGATSGNFASLDSNGNLTDSGHKHSDYLTEAPVTDVQVNGSSILNQGVANIPLTSIVAPGLVRAGGALKAIDGNPSLLYINEASDSTYKNGTNANFAVTMSKQHLATFYGLAKAAGDTTQSSSSNAVGTYTETAQSKIHEMLDAPVTVSGTTPTITGKAGIRYICGEISTLSITPPASGDIEVIFSSGSTATVLTVPNTVRFPAWFDATDLESNRTYDIIITNGTLGVVASWA